MNCKEIRSKLMSYLDSELSQDELKEIEAHLKNCPNCLSLLEELKLIDQTAKKIQPDEPSQEYWSNFALRVKEKIEAAQEKPFGFKIKRVFENIFTFTPAKAKWAVGLASLLLVFIVGVLWMQKKGVEQIPTVRKVLSIGTIDTLVKVKEKQKEVHAPKGTDEITKSKDEIPIAPKKGESAKVSIPQPAELMQPAQSSERKETVAGAKTQSIEVIAEKPTITKDVTAAENIRGGKARESFEAVSPQKTEERLASQVGFVTKKGEVVTKIKIDSEQVYLIHGIPYLSSDGENFRLWVYQETDTTLPEKELKSFAGTWKEALSYAPDSLMDKAIQQTSVGYYLLAKTTKKKEYIDEGIKTLEKYLDKITSKDTRTKVEQKLSYLKSLKEK